MTTRRGLGPGRNMWLCVSGQKEIRMKCRRENGVSEAGDPGEPGPSYYPVKWV